MKTKICKYLLFNMWKYNEREIFAQRKKKKEYGEKKKNKWKQNEKNIYK